MTAETFFDPFSQTFAPAPFGRLARETGWQQRTGKIEPGEFVASLTFAQLSPLRLSLNAQGQGLSEPVTPQALDPRYHERAVAFFAAADTHGLRESLAQPPPAPLAAARRTHFRSVVRQHRAGFAAGFGNALSRLRRKRLAGQRESAAAL